MTESYRPQSTPPPQLGTPQSRLADEGPGTAENPGTAEVVKDQAADLGHGGVEAGQHAAAVAREQASNVTAEAGRQGKDLIRQAQGQLAEQAGQQQQRLAAELRAIGDELSTMASRSDRPGVVTDLAGQAAGTTRTIAQWLDSREPGELLQEVKAFARRRPGVFLGLAATAGLLAGRLTRGIAAEAHDDGAPTLSAGGSRSLAGSGSGQGIAAGGAGLSSSAAPAGNASAGEIPVSADDFPPSWPAAYAEEESAAGGAGYERPPGGAARIEGRL